MAKPISATPVLRGEEAKRFLEEVHRNLDNRVRLTPTPKLDKACELIKKHGAANR